MDLKKIGIIGVDGIGERFATGQVLKTREFRKWFSNRYGEGQVLFANIDSAKKHPLRVLHNISKALKECENILFMPGQNVGVFAPLTAILNKHYKRRIQFIVIGGNLAKILRGKTSLIKQIASFYGTYPESIKLRDDLFDLGIKNAVYLPNCRDYVPAVEFDHWKDDPVRVCTYSRVTKDKGILDAIEIVQKANSLAGRNLFTLEIYGKMYDSFKLELDAALEKTGGVAKYMGVKESSQTLGILRTCFAILFPTYYKGECFAGTALDAFSARIPIIANDWLYNNEVIDSGENGFIYPFRNNDKAAEILYSLYRDRNLYNHIQKGCEKSMVRFSTDNVIGQLDRLLM